MGSSLPLRTGTVVERGMVLGPGSTLHVKAATVRWARGLECGLRLIHVQPGEAGHLERYITQRIKRSGPC